MAQPPMTHHICEVKSMKFVFPNAQHNETAKDNPDVQGEEGVELHITFEDSFSKLETVIIIKPEETRLVYDHIKHLLDNRQAAATLSR
jgi:hypothetical protein